MIKRLIRWLASDEIAKSFYAGLERGQSLAETREKLGYATGELDGMKKACDDVENAIRERDGSFVCRCDVERVRARLTLH